VTISETIFIRFRPEETDTGFHRPPVIESGEPGEFPVSAERLKIVLLIMDLRCDNSAEAVEFPIRAAVLSVHGKDVFLVFF